MLWSKRRRKKKKERNKCQNGSYFFGKINPKMFSKVCYSFFSDLLFLEYQWFFVKVSIFLLLNIDALTFTFTLLFTLLFLLLFLLSWPYFTIFFHFALDFFLLFSVFFFLILFYFFDCTFTITFTSLLICIDFLLFYFCKNFFFVKLLFHYFYFYFELLHFCFIDIKMKKKKKRERNNKQNNKKHGVQKFFSFFSFSNCDYDFPNWFLFQFTLHSSFFIFLSNSSKRTSN